MVVTIMDTIHVDVEELTTMAFEQFGSGIEPQLLTPRTNSSGLIVACLVPTVVAPEPADATGTSSSTSIDQDAPSPNNDPFFGVLILELNYEEYSSRDVIPTNVHSVNQPPKHLRKWTKDHLLDNVIGNPSRPVSTIHQLQTEAMFCYFDAFPTSVKPKNYKEALKESCWTEAMQEELNEFERLEVRIFQKSQENHQKQANTDTRTEERAKAGSQSQKKLTSSQPWST
ncbi:hypothetical protein Tco_1046798 [Tanacetum coccineum]